MQFGLFLPTGNNGMIVSTEAPDFHPSWDYERRLVQRAEELGYDFALSAVKYRGAPGPTHFWMEFLDSLTLSAALLSVTERIRIMGSVSVLTMHPAVVAKMTSTLSDIGGGRFGLNIVAGWLKSEYTQMGIWPGEQYWEERYEYAREYVTILRELWTTGSSSFQGRYFQLDECQLGPLPPSPIDIVCAGSSPQGLAFTADLGDIAFLAGVEAEEMVGQMEMWRAEQARAARELSAYVSYFVVMGDTDEEGVARRDRLRAGTDMASLLAMAGQTVSDGQGTTGERITRITDDRAFFNTKVICGSPATVARQFDEIARTSAPDGIMLMFEDYMEGIERFSAEVRPLMEDAQSLVR
jgi:pyrimidine oxygenase